MGLTRELRRMGYEVRVLGPCDGPPPATFVSPLGNSLPTAANGSIAPIAPDPIAQFRTLRLLRDEEFDVLHLHEPLAPGATQTALIMRPTPMIGTFHAAGTSKGYKMLEGPLRWLAGGLDHRVAVSKDARELAHNSIGGEYEVLFNGVELDRYRPADRDRDGARSQTRTVFFCGRHEDRKGLDVLLAALRLLPSDIRLLIGGDGPDTNRLRQLAGNDQRIVWLGRITDEDKIAHLQHASTFCAPSLRGESFGVVLIEAMAAGAPIVASSLDGYRNVATHDVDALLCEPGDAEQLARALIRVLDEPGLADRLRTAGTARAAEFSMTTLARRYAELYEELASAGSRSGPAAPGGRASMSRWRAVRHRMLAASVAG